VLLIFTGFVSFRFSLMYFFLFTRCSDTIFDRLLHDDCGFRSSCWDGQPLASRKRIPTFCATNVPPTHCARGYIPAGGPCLPARSYSPICI
jgi:hypothetical protein